MTTKQSTDQVSMTDPASSPIMNVKKEKKENATKTRKNSNNSRFNVSKKERNICRRQMKSSCFKTNKSFIDFKKLIDIYQKELKSLKKLKQTEIDLLEKEINNLDIVDGEQIIINNLSSLIDSDNDKSISIKQIKKDVKQFKTTTTIVDDSKCLNNYTNQKEIIDKDTWDDSSKNYEVSKNGEKFFVKVINIENMKEYNYKKIQTNLKMHKSARNHDIVAEIHDIFVCNQDGYKLYIVSEFIKGQSLNNYDTKLLTSGDIENIEALVTKCFKRKIVLGWIDEKNIMLLHDDKNKPILDKDKHKIFKFLNLNRSKHADELMENEKKKVLDSIQWLQEKSDNKIQSLCFKKIIREKQFEFILK
jgi:hypothetical protein